MLLLPAYWPALLVVPFALLVLARLAARAAAISKQQLGARADAVSGTPVHRRRRACCALGTAVLASTALLQPVGAGDEGDGGADVVLCVDVSWSMAARDTAPTRLGLAQREIAALAAAAPPSRLALVVFGGEAELAVPLTADGEAVAALAQELAAGTHTQPGTHPGAAIDLAASLLLRTGRGGSIVVLSDGEDFAGGGAAAAARAAAAGNTVHSLACGDEAGSKIVVDGDGGETFLRDGSGSDIVTRLELANLRALAAAGGGQPVRATGDALRALHDGVLLPAARASALRAGRLLPEHRFAWPLLGALLLWMLRWCLPERRR